MKNTLSARFDDRDSAALALMRLRRNGVEFSVSRLYVDGPGRDRGAYGMAAYSPYSQNITNPLGSSNSAFSNLGSHALLWQDSLPQHGDAVLQLSLDPSQIQRAREIIRSAHGRNIRVSG